MTFNIINDILCYQFKNTTYVKKNKKILRVNNYFMKYFGKIWIKLNKCPTNNSY